MKTKRQTKKLQFRSLVPVGLVGCSPLDQGLVGVSDHLRSAEPQFAFNCQ